MHTPLRVGFDLDGVLLYNPARIFRPVTLSLKSHLPFSHNRNHTHFYYPRSHFEQLIWRFVHLSSFIPAKGLDVIRALVHEHKIEAVVVTSRYDCLKDDFHRWMKRLNTPPVFHAYYHNELNLQPHEFKVKKIQELELDFFVEDNWNIIEHIASRTSARPLWITNVLDKTIEYPYKFASLRDAAHYIATTV